MAPYEAPRGPVLYHPIFSRGMMQRWIQHGWATPQEELTPEATWWNSCAPLLEDAWNFWASRHEIRDSNCDIYQSKIADHVYSTLSQLRDPSTSPPALTQIAKPSILAPSHVLEAMIRFALDAGLRSFDQGLAAALDYLCRDGGFMLLRHCAGVTGVCRSTSEIQRVELRAIAEGHISSIVRATAWCKGEQEPVVFGLNIARDMTDAADELRINTRDLRQWTELDPDSAATVYDSGLGEFLWFGQMSSLPVVAVRWLDAARELHVIRDENVPGRGSFFLINAFHESGGPLPKLLGIRLDEAVSDMVWAAIVRKRTTLASFDWQAEWVEAPNLELNHGDVVAEIDGADIRVAFVASSAQRWRGPIGAWLYEMSVSSARDERSSVSKRIYWGKPAQALRATYQGLLRKDSNGIASKHKLVRRMVESAQAMTPEQVMSFLSHPCDDDERLSIVRQTRTEIMALLARMGRS